MNRMSLLLVVMMVFTLGAAPMKAGTNEVVLNASQVSSALDIESAIDAATHDGTQPGIVTLDSSQGDFVYSDWRRSIEVSVSNITIRSRNGAVFPNCDNGILFPSSADGVAIEGLTFHCRGVGIGGGNEHSHVTIRDNTFVVGNYGIYADHAADWQIVGNYIESLGPEPGILIENSNDIEVSKNQLIMHPQFNVHQGVILDHTNNSTVSNNKITRPVMASSLKIRHPTIASLITASRVHNLQGYIWDGRWHTTRSRQTGSSAQSDLRVKPFGSAPRRERKTRSPAAS